MTFNQLDKYASVYVFRLQNSEGKGKTSNEIAI